MKCDGNHGGPMCADPECWNGGEPQRIAAPAGTHDPMAWEYWRDRARAAEEDAARWQAIKPLLHVARDQPSDWTCWLELACAPFRSKTTDPTELTDAIVAHGAGRCVVTVVNQPG